MKKSGGGKISVLANNKDTKHRCWCNCFIVAKAICAAVFVCVGGRGIMSTTVLEGEKKCFFYLGIKRQDWILGLEMITYLQKLKWL